MAREEGSISQDNQQTRELHAHLEAVLERVIDGFVDLNSCERLSAGANQETYRVVVTCRDATQTLCLRRAAGGSSETHPGQPGLAVEAQLMQAAARAAVPEPEILYILQPSDHVGPGFLMTWLEGETLGARIARSEALAPIRGQLAKQCGTLLARIHAVDIDAAGLRDGLELRSPAEITALALERYDGFDTPQPMIDYAARWLQENLPRLSEPRLVHGDFRNGNLMVTQDAGVVAVLDWEGAHIGDPMRDLGWLCTNSWRFGVTEKWVGGFGDLDDLIAGYEAESGAAVDLERVKFWIVYGSFSWAIGCLTMAEHYRTGPDATVERPAIGRRSSECQIDLANLLIPGPVTLPQILHCEDNKDMPRSDELLTSVRDFLRDEIMSVTEGRTHFMARVAANSLDILLREAELGPAYHSHEQTLLASMLDMEGDLYQMRMVLCQRIRNGEVSLDDAALKEYLRFATLAQVLIDQPKYSGVRTALESS